MDMKILAIESSCDETAAAVVEDGAKILSNVVVSQIDIFKEYGGVIPEVAARSHLEAILPVIHRAMSDAGVTNGEIDAIAVTHTPGLLGSLLIGTLTARMLAILWGKPFYGVHHLKSHIYANWVDSLSHNPTAAQTSALAEARLVHRTESMAHSDAPAALNSISAEGLSTKAEKQVTSSKITASEEPSSSSPITSSKEGSTKLVPSGENQNDSASLKNTLLKESSSLPRFPLLALVISGGHTQIIYMADHNQFEIIGTTRDDAVGECFDKVAKILGLPYPGGPSIAQASAISSSNFALQNSAACVAQKKKQASSSFAVLDSSDSPVRSRRMSNTSPLRASNLPSTSSKLEAIEKQKWYKEHPHYKLPHPKVEGLDFSFSGLKTAVLRAVQAECGLPITTPSYELKNHLSEQQVADFAAAFQETACDILLEKLKMALEAHPEAKSLVFAGGVSANKVLREKALGEPEKGLRGAFEGYDAQIYFPDPRLSGDNAVMVGIAAYYEIMLGVQPSDPYKMSIAPRTAIG